MRAWGVLRLGDDNESGVISTLNVEAYTTIVTTVGDTIQSTASISLNSDGTIAIYAYGEGSAWHNIPTAGLGASYWAIVTLTSGSLTAGTSGSRVSLTAGHTWSITTTGTSTVRTKNAVGTIQIWDAAAAGNMVSSGTFELSATVEASASNQQPPPSREPLPIIPVDPF
jgi:hypothetical protein